jgi:hypothetical protein
MLPARGYLGQVSAPFRPFHLLVFEKQPLHSLVSHGSLQGQDIFRI